VGGALLDQETCSITLGTAVGEMVALSVEPECFGPNEQVSMNSILQNTGDISLSGTLITVVRALDGSHIESFRTAFEHLMPGQTFEAYEVWDTTYGRGSCHILSYAQYDGKSSKALVFPKSLGSTNSDLDNDGRIDMADFAIIAVSWLCSDDSADIAPAGGDCTVNELDLMALAYDWLNVIR
jgi:hypothetical protein